MLHAYTHPCKSTKSNRVESEAEPLSIEKRVASRVFVRYPLSYFAVLPIQLFGAHKTKDIEDVVMGCGPHSTKTLKLDNAHQNHPQRTLLTQMCQTETLMCPLFPAAVDSASQSYKHKILLDLKWPKFIFVYTRCPVDNPIAGWMRGRCGALMVYKSWDPIILLVFSRWEIAILQMEINLFLSNLFECIWKVTRLKSSLIQKMYHKQFCLQLKGMSNSWIVRFNMIKAYMW